MQSNQRHRIVSVGYLNKITPQVIQKFNLIVTSTPSECLTVLSRNGNKTIFLDQISLKLTMPTFINKCSQVFAI